MLLSADLGSFVPAVVCAIGVVLSGAVQGGR